MSKTENTIKNFKVDEQTKNTIEYNKHIKEVLDKKPTFERKDLLRDFERAYLNNSNDLDNVLFDLGVWIAFAVVKRVLDPVANNDRVSESGHDKKLLQIRNELYNNAQRLRTLARDNDNSYRNEYLKNGDIVKRVNDIGSIERTRKTVSENMSDGLDLVNVAIESILSNCKKYHEMVVLENNFLECPINMSYLSKRTYVNDKNVLTRSLKERESCIIKEAFRDVRRYIMNNRSLSVDTKYVYIEDILLHHDSNGRRKEETIYKRVKHDRTLFVGSALEYNIETGETETNVEMLDRMETMIESLGLTDRQSRILQLKLDGYGMDVIANTLNVKKTTISRQLDLIQKKAIDVFKLDVSIYGKKEVSKAGTGVALHKDDIIKLYNEGRTMKYIADMYNVNKSTISRIVNNVKRIDRK